MEEVKFRDSKKWGYNLASKLENSKIKKKNVCVDIKNIGNGISFDDWSGLRGI